MKRFFYKLALFLIPIILVYLPPFIILKGSKENFMNINSILNGNKNYLIGYAYNENNYAYLKWKTINIKPKYETIALGSSRVLQFRKEMFKSSFYNAGYTISKINDFINFIHSLPIEKYPRYLILGLDQWMFNLNWDESVKIRLKDYWKNSFSYFPRSSIYLSVYKDLLKGKYGMNVIYNNSPVMEIGLNSIINNTGFRNDGSMYYGKQIYKLINKDKSANDYEFEDTYSRIKDGNKRFEYGNIISQQALVELDKMLKYCKLNDIKIVGFIPPFANSVYNKLMESEKYIYLNRLSKYLIPLFNKYNYEFYYYPSGESCNSTDKDFIDGFHGGEVVYSRILIDMLKNNSILNEVASKSHLESDIQNRNNRFLIYK